MPVHNSDVADVFDELADLLDIQGANEFRIRAYRNAARVTRNWPTQFCEILKRGEALPKLPGIGADLSAKTAEIALNGTCALLEEVRAQTPRELAAILKIPGLGPKRVRLLQRELGVSSLADLEARARNSQIQELRGFSVASESKIIEELERLRKPGDLAPVSRMNLAVAEQIARPLMLYLKAMRGVERAAVAGSFRRQLETIGDIDILASCRAGSEAMRRFVEYEDVTKVLSRGETRSTVVLRNGIQVDLRVVAPESYGAALHYFTGSKAHNIAIRALGVKRRLKINEYGIFRGKTRIGGRREEEVFAAVGLPYIEPELRENRGEIEAARSGTLPALVTLAQVRGDLHAHTRETDGRLSLEEMAFAAKMRGYEYLAITDHSQRLAMTRGLTPARLKSQLRAIDDFNRGGSGFKLLKGIEVDILEDGCLDLPDEVLSLLDLAVCSIHSKFDLPEHRQTERIIRAMENPYFQILGHPTGRVLGERPPYSIDMEKIVRAARDKGCFLELNAQPERMDLSGVHCKMAKDAGVLVVISTDAHGENDFDYMKYGISQARRGWLGASDVLNTRNWEQIHALLRRPGGTGLAKAG